MIRTLQQISALELGGMLVTRQMSSECFEKLAAYAIGYLKGCHDTASQGAAILPEPSDVQVDATSLGQPCSKALGAKYPKARPGETLEDTAEHEG